MPEIDVVDATWIGVPPTSLAAVVANPANWRRWWPDFDLEVSELRGPKGVRWRVRSAHAGALAGSMELWLQPADDGTVAHYFLRLDATQATHATHATRRTLRPRERTRLIHEYRVRAKRVFWAIADRLDPGRLARVAGPPDTIP